MSIRLILEDAWALYEKQRYYSAFVLALVGIEATAKRRYDDPASPPCERDSGKRFRMFLNDEIPKHTSLRALHAIDMPPYPVHPPGPEASDDSDEALNRYFTERDAWDQMREKQDATWREQFIDVGDDYKRAHGKPRLVSTIGILYEARNQFIHEGRLSSFVLSDRCGEEYYSIGGGPPIEISTSWIKYIILMLIEARENVGQTGFTIVQG